MLTMHSVLRDRYEGLATIMDVALLVLSGILTAQLLADPKLLSLVHVDSELGDVIARVCSVAVFLVSLAMLRIDLKGKLGAFRQSADSLAQVKSDLRTLAENSSLTPDQIVQGLRSARAVIDSLPKIPDKLFASLKAAHLRKVVVSKAIDKDPCTNLPVLRLRLFFQGLKAATSADLTTSPPLGGDLEHGS